MGLCVAFGCSLALENPEDGWASPPARFPADCTGAPAVRGSTRLGRGLGFIVELDNPGGASMLDGSKVREARRRLRGSSAGSVTSRRAKHHLRHPGRVNYQAPSLPTPMTPQDDALVSDFGSIQERTPHYGLARGAASLHVFVLQDHTDAGLHRSSTERAHQARISISPLACWTHPHNSGAYGTHLHRQ